MKKILLSFAIVITLFLGMYWIAGQAVRKDQSVGSAQNGLVAIMATSSTQIVGIQQNKTLFETKPFCAARVITTAGQGIMLSFVATSTLAPSGTQGIFQAASTTVAYDSGIYGCGATTAYGFAASSTITISESI